MQNNGGFCDFPVHLWKPDPGGSFFLGVSSLEARDAKYDVFRGRYTRNRGILHWGGSKCVPLMTEVVRGGDERCGGGEPRRGGEEANDAAEANHAGEASRG